MSISLFASLITILALTPLWTHQLYLTSFNRQKTMIALDNAAIVLGRQDRMTLNFVEKANETIKLIELIHHPIHFAVVSGIASPQVVAQDVSLEATLKEIHFTSRRVADVKWASSLSSAIAEVGRLGTEVIQHQRGLTSPLIKKRCAICNLDTFWLVDANRTDSFLRVKSGDWISAVWVRLLKSLNKNKADWNYQLSLR